MENKRILLVGGGGHFKSVLDSLLSVGGYSDIGFVDKTGGSASVLDIPCIGSDVDLPAFFEAGWTHAFIAVGSIGNTALRRKLFERAKQAGFTIPAIIDKSAAVAGDVQIPEGIFIGKNTVINTNASLGVCSIINSGSVVEHDCRIGDFAHISPGTVLCGQVTVGENTHVGAGSVVRQQITIGRDSVIGIGSVVVKNIPNAVEAFGNPCTVVKKL